MLLLGASLANAQTVTIDATEITDQRVVVVTIEWTADGAGVVPSTSFNTTIPDLTTILEGRHCYYAETQPGVTPPTALYDITIADAWGLDVFGGRLADRSATVAEDAPPLIGAISDNFAGAKTLTDVWTFSVENAGAGGQGTVRVYFR